VSDQVNLASIHKAQLASQAANEKRRLDAAAAAPKALDRALAEDATAPELDLGGIKAVALETLALGMFASRRAAKRGFKSDEIQQLQQLVQSWKMLASDASEREIERRVEARMAAEIARAKDLASGVALADGGDS
jgi:hypothetical protein